MLFLSIILGALLGLLLKGKLLRLAALNGLIFPILSFAVMPLLRFFPDIQFGLKAIIICFSYACIFAFIIANRRYWLSGLALGLGSLSNFLVIAINGFRMPVSPGALAVYPEMTAEAVLARHADYFIATEGARLMFLGDVINLPLPLLGGFISLGDVLIALGMLLLVVFAMRDAENDARLKSDGSKK
ncbi:MAG: DUF5317 family protein [Oscillospiraceae bacterium]